MRLDKAVVERGLARSRTEAQRLIDGGLVTVDGVVVSKASLETADDAVVEILGAVCPYVSRGGLKLAAALDAFGIDVAGRLCLDVGASTGGFTDCLLQRGANRVVAVDVGHGQMDPALAADSRVELREGVNARSISAADFDAAFDVVVGDLSFISLTLVLPALSTVAASGGDLVLLVKPQFEVGPTGIGKGGIVREAQLRQDAVDRVLECAGSTGLDPAGTITSPITGGDGNEEYLMHLRRGSR